MQGWRNRRMNRQTGISYKLINKKEFRHKNNQFAHNNWIIVTNRRGNGLELMMQHLNYFSPLQYRDSSTVNKRVNYLDVFICMIIRIHSVPVEGKVILFQYVHVWYISCIIWLRYTMFWMCRRLWINIWPFEVPWRLQFFWWNNSLYCRVSVYIFIHVSFIHPSIHSSIHPFIHPIIHPYIYHLLSYPFIHSFDHLFNWYFTDP